MINTSYNHNHFNPVDGELVKAADDLAAFMEAHLALENGISNPQLQAAVHEKQLRYKNRVIAGINLFDIYEKLN